MAASPSSTAMPPLRQGTTWIDRINVSVHLRRYIKICLRRIWIPILFVIAGTGIAWGIASNLPNRYRAYSTLGFATRVETDVGGKARVVELAENLIEQNIGQMRSQRVHQKVHEYMREADAARGVRPEIEPTVNRGNGSLIVMTVESTDLAYARLYASNWARAFVTHKAEVGNELIEKKFGQTRQDVKRYEQNLERARENTLAFKKKNNIGDIRDAGLAAQERLNRIQAEYDEIVLIRKRLESYIRDELLEGKMPDALNKSSSKDSTTVAAPDKIKIVDPLAPFRQASYSEVKLALRAREADLFRYQATLKPRHPFMVNLNTDIQRLRQELQFQFDNIEERRRAEIEKLKKDETGLLPRIEELRREVFEKSAIGNEYEKLKNRRPISKRNSTARNAPRSPSKTPRPTTTPTSSPTRKASASRNPSARTARRSSSSACSSVCSRASASFTSFTASTTASTSPRTSSKVCRNPSSARSPRSIPRRSPLAPCS
jgi:hypothetical protein